MWDDNLGPSPVDIDNIHDYFQAQQLGTFFRAISVVYSDEYQAALKKIEREVFKSRVGCLILWLELGLIVALAIYVVYI